MSTNETLWNGFRRVDFVFEGKEAILVFPETADMDGKWLLKTEYFGAFPEFEIAMVNRGWHLAYIQNQTRWCLEEDLDRKKRFATYLHTQYGLNEKCVPVGMSCGGLIATKFAAKYPECVSVLYLDAPVMNFLSCPAGLGKAGADMFPEFEEAMGMGMSELICYREHPMDKVPQLLQDNIPVIMVYGDSDGVVPYDENGAVLERLYRNGGGIIEVIGKVNCGHHPHSLQDVTPIINFVEEHSK